MTNPCALTPAKEQRLRKKIDRIRKEIAYEKQKWRGYHDGRGLRYLPPGLFIQLRDYKGGLRYLRWFDRMFPDDATYPMFLFDWALILYKTGKSKEAELKAYACLIEGNYIMETFIGSMPLPDEARGPAEWEREPLEEHFTYSADDPEYADFAVWLKNLFQTDTLDALGERYRLFEAQRREAVRKSYLEETERIHRKEMDE